MTSVGRRSWELCVSREAVSSFASVYNYSLRHHRCDHRCNRNLSASILYVIIVVIFVVIVIIIITRPRPVGPKRIVGMVQFYLTSQG